MRERSQMNRDMGKSRPSYGPMKKMADGGFVGAPIGEAWGQGSYGDASPYSGVRTAPPPTPVSAPAPVAVATEPAAAPANETSPIKSVDRDYGGSSNMTGEYAPSAPPEPRSSATKPPPVARKDARKAPPRSAFGIGALPLGGPVARPAPRPAQRPALTLGTQIKPGDYDKGASIVRDQMRSRSRALESDKVAQAGVAYYADGGKVGGKKGC